MELIERFLTKEEYSEILTQIDEHPEMDLKRIESEYSTHYGRIVRVEIDRRVFQAGDYDPRPMKEQIASFFADCKELGEIRKLLPSWNLPKGVWVKQGEDEFPVGFRTEEYLRQKEKWLKEHGYETAGIPGLCAGLGIVLKHLGQPLPTTNIPYIMSIAEDITQDPYTVADQS